MAKKVRHNECIYSCDECGGEGEIEVWDAQRAAAREKLEKKRCSECVERGFPPIVRVVVDPMFGIDSGQVKADCPPPKKYGQDGGYW